MGTVVIGLVGTVLKTVCIIGKGESYVEAQVEGYAHVDKVTRVHI